MYLPFIFITRNEIMLTEITLSIQIATENEKGHEYKKKLLIYILMRSALTHGTVEKATC